MSMQSGGVPPYSNNVPPRYIRGRGRADPMQMPRGGGYRGNHHITTGPGGMNIAHTTGQQGLITMPIPPRVGLQQPTSMAQGRQVLIPHQQQQPPTHQPSQHVLLPNPNPHVLTQAGLRYIPSGLHVPSMYPPGVPSNFATGTPQLFLPQGQFMPPNAGQPINLQPPQAQLPLTQPQAFSAGNSSATTARPLATRKKNPIRIVNPDTGVEVSLTAENPAPVAPPVSVVVPAASVGVPSNETSSNSGTSGVPEDFKRKVFSTIQNHEDAANQQPVAPPLFQVPAPPPPPPNALIRHPDSLKNGSKVEAEAGVGDDRPIVPGPQVAFVATVAASTAAVETVITEKSKITNESETIAPPSTQAEPLPAAPQVAPESSSSKPESVAASTAIASETIDDVAVPTTAATVLPPEPPTEILEGKKETVSQEQRTAVEVPEEPVKPEGAEQSQPEKPVEPVISEKESRLEAEEIVEETEDSPQTEEKDVEILTAESAATPQENGDQEAAPTGESSAEPPSEVVSSLNGEEEGSVKAEVSLEVPAAPEPEEIAPETETSEKKEIKPEESSRAEPAVEEAGQGPSVPEVTEQKDLAEGKPKTEPRISKSLPEAEPVDKPAQAVPETEPAVRTVAPVESDLVSKVEKKPEPEVSKPVSQPPEPVKPEKQDTKTEEVVVNSIPHHQSPPPQPHPHIPPPPQPSQSGRTMYDRNFLLAFKGMEVCKTVPEELQNTECFKPFAYKDQPPMDISSSRDVFVPFGQGGGGRGRRGRGSEPKRIMHQPLRVEKVELHKAATPWQRTTEDAAELSEKEKATQELYRKFQGILNKLTPQKFQSLAEQALQLDISSEERLRGVIDKIFTKALEEPSFSIAYANLCKVLSPVKVDWTAPDGKPRSTNFRRVLLTKCQQEFEKDKKDDENREQMLKAIEEADTPEKKKELEVELATFETKNRRRSLGNIRFIGELFKLHMLSATIMHECVIRLLRSTSDEESLECFARLITTTGKDLDVAQAKPRIDNYFSRIDDIIKKSKVPARIKFMLQDVQELRSHKWVPRSGQDNTLKTIDQIHAEARAEAEMTKQMVVQHQMSSMKGGGGRGGDDRRKGRDSKPSHDEWTKVEKEKKQQPPVKADISRIRTMMMKKSKEPTLGPPGTVGLRPVWGGRGTAASMATPEAAKAEREKEREPAGSKHTRPGRSSSSGQKRSDKERERDRERDRAPSGRGSSSGPKRSHTFPDNQEKQSAIQTLKEITTAKPPMQKAAAPAQAVQPVAPADTLEPTIARKSSTIVNELSQNNDFKEAMECVKEMQSSGLMHVFVRDSITHSLEQSSHARKCLGRLFPMLVKEGLVSQEKLVAGLNEVLEYAEDYEIDIPKVWDYIGELLAPSVLQSSLSLPALTGVPSSLTDTGKTAILVAKTLHQCTALGSESDTSDLWSQSQLQWSSLGVKSEDVEEFLSRQKLEFLQAGGPSQSSTPQAPPPYLQDLARLFGASDTTNDDIFDWIEKNCAQEDVETPQFIRTLTTAVVQATVSGSGTSAIFQDERFNKRMIVLKKYVNMQKDLQLEVLYALQIAVAKLEHPPKILNGMFNQAYDVEVVGEESCYRWRDKGTENFGKGNAVQSVKSFFEWLESAETESDGEGTT